MWDECCSAMVPIPWPRSLHTGCLPFKSFHPVRVPCLSESNGGSKCENQNQAALYIFDNLLGLEPWIHVGLRCERSQCMFSNVRDFKTLLPLCQHHPAALPTYQLQVENLVHIQRGLQRQAQDFHISQLPANHQTNKIGANSNIIRPAPLCGNG